MKTWLCWWVVLLGFVAQAEEATVCAGAVVTAGKLKSATEIDFSRTRNMPGTLCLTKSEAGIRFVIHAVGPAGDRLRLPSPDMDLPVEQRPKVVGQAIFDAEGRKWAFSAGEYSPGQILTLACVYDLPGGTYVCAGVDEKSPTPKPAASGARSL